MNRNRLLVLAALGAAFALGGCASSAGGGGSALPALAPQSQTLSPESQPIPESRTISTQSVAPATLQINTSLAPIRLSGGQTKFLPCAVQITSADSHGAYIVYASATAPRGPSSFLTGSVLGTSAITLTVPDLGTAPVALAGAFFPGAKLWSGAIGQAQSHCVDVTVKVPSGQPAGTYTATLQYTMLENIRLGLYATRAIGSAVLTTTVGTATIR
jgi:hypothetical protein